MQVQDCIPLTAASFCAAFGAAAHCPQNFYLPKCIFLKRKKSTSAVVSTTTYTLFPVSATAAVQHPSLYSDNSPFVTKNCLATSLSSLPFTSTS